MNDPLATQASAVEPLHDTGLTQRGYCGRLDLTGRCRCYRRRGHPGECTFSPSFQLMQQLETTDWVWADHN